MPAPMEHFLTKEEIQYLRTMAERSQGWTYLLKLLRLLEEEALRQLQSFRSSEDAFEKRGYANGVSMVVGIIKSLYMERTDGSPSGTRANKDAASDSSTESEPDTKPESFAY